MVSNLLHLYMHQRSMDSSHSFFHALSYACKSNIFLKCKLYISVKTPLQFWMDTDFLNYVDRK